MKILNKAPNAVNIADYQKHINNVKEKMAKSFIKTIAMVVALLFEEIPELEQLADSNGWETDKDVFQSIEDKFLKPNKHGVLDEEGIFQLVYATVTTKYEKPQPKPSTTSTSKSSLKPQTLEYDLEEGLMGLEIKWDKKTTLSKEEFETKFKETHGKNYDYKFEYSETKVKASTLLKEKDEDEEVEEELLFTVEEQENEEDPDAEPFFVIRKPDGELLEDESGDNDGEPQIFDSEEEAENMAKQLNISLKEKEKKPKREKKLKKPVETAIVKPLEDEVLEETNEKKTELPESQVELPKVETVKVEKEKNKKEEKVIETNDDLEW